MLTIFLKETPFVTLTCYLSSLYLILDFLVGKREEMFQRLGRWLPFGRQQQRRNFTTSSLRRSGDHHDEGGIPGRNLPFGIDNHRLLILMMGLYMGSGFATPFLLLRHQLLKKSAD